MEQLNIRTNNWRDLLTDAAFTRADIITLQQPQHLEKFNIADFHHVKHSMKVEEDCEFREWLLSDSKNDNILVVFDYLGLR